MNAVAIGVYDFDESELMPSNENEDLLIRVAKLETNVQHIREDVSEIKTELRGTNQRIDALSEKMDKRFDALIGDTNQRFEKIDSRFDAAKEDVNKRFDKQDARMDRIEEKVSSILLRLESWKVWALGLYAAQSGALLWIMAKGFKWL